MKKHSFPKSRHPGKPGGRSFGSKKFESKSPGKFGVPDGGFRPPKRKFDPRAARGEGSDELGKKITGKLKLHPDGFGFVQPDGKVPAVFLPEHEASKALDGDRLEVEIVPGNDGRSAGRVVRLVDRVRELVLGTYFVDGKRAFVKPRDTALGPIEVPPTQLARDGDVVKVRLGIGERLLGPREGLTGEVAGSMGRMDDRSAEVLSLAYAKGFNDEFPAEVMDEADGFPLTVDVAAALAEGRVDLRSTPLVTIDGEDARDFDDAIYVERKGGGFRLVVAIADVAWYVRPGSSLDAEARRRGTSVYLPGRVLPMLPERLSNGLCSLRPDEDRLCLVAELELDGDGVVTAEKVFSGLMRSHARLTYGEVQAALDLGTLPGREKLVPMLKDAWALAEKFKKRRGARGAIDFDLPETKVELDEAGAPVKLVRRDRLDSHRLVEEHMLAANESVARWFRAQDLPVVNRFHGPPDEEKLEIFAKLARAHGLNVAYGVPTSKELDALLKQLEGHAEQRALNQLLLRSMMQAVYSADQTGHYGLAADDYLHFTSPIRRYPDLLVHRGLWQHWRREGDGEDLAPLAEHSSDRERAAAQTEREVTALYSCLIAQKLVDQDLPGKVVGITENGAFVELTEHFIEGFLKAPPGAQFDASTFRMRLGGGKELRLGAEITVRVVDVNLRRRHIDLEAVGAIGTAVERRAGGGHADEGAREDRPRFDRAERSVERPRFDRNGPPGDRPKFERGGKFGDRPKFDRAGPPGDRPRFDRAGPPGDRPKFDRGGPPGDRPRFDRGGKFGDRPKFDRGGPPGDRPKFDRGGKFGDRPKFDRGGPPGDRPKFDRGGKFGDRPKFDRGGKFGDRPKFDRGGPPGDRPKFDRGGKFGDRPKFDRGGPPGDRPKFERGGEFGDRPKFDRGGKFGDRPKFDRAGAPGDRPKFDRGGKFGDRPKFDRGGPPGDRPKFDRGGKFGDRPKFDRAAPPGDRPKFDRGGKFGDRPRFDRAGPSDTRPAFEREGDAESAPREGGFTPGGPAPRRFVPTPNRFAGATKTFGKKPYGKSGGGKSFGKKPFGGKPGAKGGRGGRGGR